MKITHFLLAVLLVPWIACSTTSRRESRPLPESDPETVLITYHVKSGKEEELQDALSRVWEIYRKEHLVFAQPHVIVRDKEDGDKTRFVEIFTWESHAGPEHVPDAVKKLWDQMQSLCEARNGHGGLEGSEVELITPEHHGSK
jgi:hypothetical protein